MASKLKQEDYIDIEIGSIGRAIYRNIGIVVMVSVLAAMLSFATMNETYKPQYVTNTVLAMSAKETLNTVNNNNIQSQKAAIVFRKLVENGILTNKIAQMLEIPSFPGTISCQGVEDTNLLRITIAANTPQYSFEGMKLLLENYDKISDKLFENVIIEVIEAPRLPQQASNKNNPIKWAITVGMLAAIAMVFLISIISILSDTIKSKKQFERKLDMRCLGVLKHEKQRNTNKSIWKSKSKNISQESLIITNPVISFDYLESIKKISSKIERACDRREYKMIVVTSALENEGKSTIAANIALGLAQKKNKVLLIDGDLRHPSQKLIFKKEINAKHNMANFLIGKSDLHKIITYDEKKQLYMILNDKFYEDSTEQVSSEAMKCMLMQAREEMDYVIIDAPPIDLMADAEVYADYADAALIVVRQEYATTSVVNDSIDVLKRSHAKVIGGIFNGVRENPAIGRNSLGYNRYGYRGKYGYHKKSKYDYRMKQLSEED